MQHKLWNDAQLRISMTITSAGTVTQLNCFVTFDRVMSKYQRVQFSEAQAVKWLVTTVAVETCSYFKANLKTFNVIN